MGSMEGYSQSLTIPPSLSPCHPHRLTSHLTILRTVHLWLYPHDCILMTVSSWLYPHDCIFMTVSLRLYPNDWILMTVSLRLYPNDWILMTLLSWHSTHDTVLMTASTVVWIMLNTCSEHRQKKYLNDVSIFNRKN